MNANDTLQAIQRGALLFAVVFCLCCTIRAAQAAEPAKTVSLVIDYGDGVQKHFTKLPWKEGMTVQAAMTLADKHPRGIDFQYTGSGSTALLTRIDDVDNQGAGGNNWIYRVNGKLGDRSFGVKRIDPGDKVRWTFGTYSP